MSLLGVNYRHYFNQWLNFDIPILLRETIYNQFGQRRYIPLTRAIINSLKYARRVDSVEKLKTIFGALYGFDTPQTPVIDGALLTELSEPLVTEADDILLFEP